YTQYLVLSKEIPYYIYSEKEAITAGVLAAIRDDDIINNYFRGDGMALRVRGAVTLEDQMAWWFGKQSPGRPVTSLVPTNYTALDKGVIGATSSCLGGDADLMMGIALAQKMKKTGKIVAFVTGDGTLGKGNYHETFTMASLFKLPILFVIRANGWAMSTSVERSVAFRRVSDMAQAYQIPAETVDGNDVLAVRNMVRIAAEFARSGGGPVIIEAKTYRMAAHSSHDEDDYRPIEEKKHWAAKDPLLVMERIMQEFDIPQTDINAIRNDSISRVNAAFERCKNAPPAEIGPVIAQQEAIVNHMWGRE
ncbi:MAG: thiamine pyrophosphate-dependent dehydrogenase E1 component subunit alpha, partial [Oscillospiraceae bacterium]|nr:thiamine pyrophosphate-dependent dehydrogenase E1 component subunit alpha [Oscillospiraceae bacterium]